AAARAHRLRPESQALEVPPHLREVEARVEREVDAREGDDPREDEPPLEREEERSEAEGGDDAVRLVDHEEDLRARLPGLDADSPLDERIGELAERIAESQHEI